MPSSKDRSTTDGSGVPSQAIIDAIATREGVDPTDIAPPEYDPLYSVVNPEALDELISTTTQSRAVVAFEYEGYDVVVRGNGRVDVSDPSDESGSLSDRLTD
ncbi:HalOD1 output domain-containing protein [Natronobacterium gregoryi]|uniref:Halobacterial output domain-containing protein n=2 Tax=Natronobacterium gregoryi TaxID=44930 RepID=L0ALY7_NATGS|nr:HalOD1 output domain-containing protein [Natronobacterium gregoryi]AFZ74908.1 hypothetical protein Natgr_3813 [Natronobacterium gregoryi SP2]ELY67385.1 hypothetical protein C490_11056 [Natronobacterium gregoryi SP2]PLK19836.1 hypothetical protein CYV19_12540 [Natronobacterium gregoryi SP2]SFJ38932.1 hypothetical protein SAMN05443661_1264 [Natronobacterium gregoryi]